MRAEYMWGLALALAMLSGCSGDRKPTTAEGSGGDAVSTEAAVVPKRPAAMTDKERVEAVGITLISASPIESEAKTPRWKMVARVVNGTDIDLEGVEVHAALYPPGSLGPLAMHVREVLFEERLGYTKERLIEMEFPASASDAAPDEIRKELRIAALVQSKAPDPKWQVLDEGALSMARESAPSASIDPEAEAAKLRQHLMNQEGPDAKGDGAAAARRPHRANSQG